MRDALTLPRAIDEVVGVATNRQSVPTSTSADVICTSSSSQVDIEKQRYSVTSSKDAIHDHVDIQYAEEQFADLKRRYSNLSRAASTTSHQPRRRSHTADGEKGREGVDGGEYSENEFDLEDVLRDRHRRETENDIKPKHLGMIHTWCR
jgi:hypothetical protein